MNSFTAQRCSVGTTLLDFTFSPALRCPATPQTVSLVKPSTFSPAAEVSPAREHLCFFTSFQFATQEVRHAHSPDKNALFPLHSKSTFLSVSFRITHFIPCIFSLWITFSAWFISLFKQIFTASRIHFFVFIFHGLYARTVRGMEFLAA